MPVLSPVEGSKGEAEGKNPVESIRVRKCLVRRLAMGAARVLSKDSSGVGNPADETAQHETHRHGNQASNEKFQDRRDVNR
jgi:hypothetical protein